MDEVYRNITNAPSLDLHGTHPSDVQTTIDRFLFQSFHKKEMILEIVYGFGKEILKKESLDFLNAHPLVEKVVDKGGSCIVLLGK